MFFHKYYITFHINTMENNGSNVLDNSIAEYLFPLPNDNITMTRYDGCSLV